MDSDIYRMAVGCYGYGSWEAPYWFIGPEQEMAPNDDIQRRLNAWLRLGGKELSDCREFHEVIGEVRWHGEKPKLQKTWKQLMLLLMAFQGAPMSPDNPKDKEKLCIYQRDHWGRLNDETCVIELSGLPTHTYKASGKQRLKLFEAGQFDTIRRKRIAVIRERILTHKPKLIVMYGRNEREHWEKIAEVTQQLPPDVRPILAFPNHPESVEGVKNAYWEELGMGLRKERQRVAGHPVRNSNGGRINKGSLPSGFAARVKRIWSTWMAKLTG
jgi:hypothetical protein